MSESLLPAAADDTTSEEHLKLNKKLEIETETNITANKDDDGCTKAIDIARHFMNDSEKNDQNNEIEDKNKKVDSPKAEAPTVPKASLIKNTYVPRKSKDRILPNHFESFTRDSLDATGVKNSLVTRQSASSSDLFSITQDSGDNKTNSSNEKSSTDLFPNKNLYNKRDKWKTSPAKRKPKSKLAYNQSLENRSWCCKSKISIAFALSLAALLIVSVSAVILVASSNRKKHKHFHGENPLPFERTVEQYRKAAVVSGSPICSKIGADILRMNGSAVDAAIATCLCTGVVNKHSSGIGGGGFMLVYNREKNVKDLTDRFDAIDFRESAPGKATQNMFENDNSRIGGKTIAVPGEVKGLKYAHKKYGNLPWHILVEPSIYLARNGVAITERLQRITNAKKKMIQEDIGLRRIMLGSNNEPRPTGFILKDEALARTLEKVRDNPNSFYTGKLAERIVKDIQQAGGMITLDDLANYNVEKRRVIRERLHDYKFFTMGAPTGGPVVAQILNILKNDRLKRSDVTTNDLNRVALTYHRILEAMKFAFAKKNGEGDPNYNDRNSMYKLIDSMVNDTEGEIINGLIDNYSTHDYTFYNTQYAPSYDYGTSHVNVLAENGDAVSLTTSINDWFGSGFRSTETGITYNNQMQDFSVYPSRMAPLLPAAFANFIHSGKRPTSSMSQIIMTNGKGEPKLIIGAAGGKKIIPAIALVIINKVWFGDTLDHAINRKRFYTSLFPNRVRAEKTDARDKKLISLLRAKNHFVVAGETLENSEVLAIYVKKNGDIHVSTDVRRHSHSDGY